MRGYRCFWSVIGPDKRKDRGQLSRFFSFERWLDEGQDIDKGNAREQGGTVMNKKKTNRDETIVARRDRGIAKPSDLKGKKI